MRIPILRQEIPYGYYGIVLDGKKRVLKAERPGICRVGLSDTVIYFPQRPLIWEETIPLTGALPKEGGLSFVVNFSFRIVWQYPDPITEVISLERLQKLITVFPHGDYYTSARNNNNHASLYVSKALHHSLGEFVGLSWEALWNPAHKGKEIKLIKENLDELQAAGISVQVKVISNSASEQLAQHLEAKKRIARDAEVQAKQSRADHQEALARAKSRAEISLIETEAQVERTELFEKAKRLERAGRLEESLNEIRAFAERQKAITPQGVRFEFARTLGHALAAQSQLPSELLRVFINQITSQTDPRAIQKTAEGLAQLTAGREHSDKGDAPSEDADDNPG